jgi:hypothetical protein
MRVQPWSLTDFDMTSHTLLRSWKRGAQITSGPNVRSRPTPDTYAGDTATEDNQVRWIPLSLIGLLIAPAVRADWEYTRWEMTSEQVVAAFEGKAKLLPEQKRPRVPPLVTAATGEFNDGPMQLRTVFSFNIERGSLVRVSYGVLSPDHNGAFKTALVSRYGPPQTTSTISFLGQEHLGWKTATDEINASLSKDEPAYAMHCARK